MADLDAAVRISGRVDPSFDRAFRRGQTAVKGLDSRLDGLGIPRGLTDGTERAARQLGRLDHSGRQAARGVRAARDGIRGLDRQARRAGDGVGRLQRTLGGLRGGGGLGGVGLGFAGIGGLLAARRSIQQALEREVAEIRLRTVVVSDDDRAVAARRLREDAQSLARSREAALATEGELVESFYQTSSAGLSEQLARDAGVVSHRVARVTGGNISQVTATVARAMKMFGDQIGGSVEQRAERIGDILATVQQAEQISDFGALGEGIKAGAASIAAAGIRFEDGVALLGRLNSLGLEGSMAGTGMQSFAAELPRAADNLKFKIERTNDGLLDVEATLRNIQRKIDGLDPDKAVLKLQKGFGQEAVKVFNLLAGSIDDLGPAFERVRGPLGNVRRDYEEMADSVAGRTEQAKQNLEDLATAATNVLLPALGELAEPAAEFGGELAEWIEKSPAAADGIKALAVGLGALGAAALAVKFGAGAIAFLTGPAGLTALAAASLHYGITTQRREFRENLAEAERRGLRGQAAAVREYLGPAAESEPRFRVGDISRLARDVARPRSMEEQAAAVRAHLGLPLLSDGSAEAVPSTISYGDVHITVQGGRDPRETARQVRRELEEESRRSRVAAEWDER